MLEQGNYPYIRGKGGIPLDKMDFDGEKGKGTIKGGSQRDIEYFFSNTALRIHDWPRFYLRLDAIVTSGQLTMDLKTKDSEFVESRGRHPDLYAGEFVDLVFRYFEGRGTVISVFKGEWFQGSDNYRRFMANRSILDQSLVEAANNTWSGNALRRNGFSVVCSDDVRVYSANRARSHVSAYFKKAT